MKFLIKHEVQGRLRIHVIRNRMTCTEADVLCWALEKQKSVIKVKVYERTADAVIYYTGAVSYTHLDVYKRQAMNQTVKIQRMKSGRR